MQDNVPTGVIKKAKVIQDKPVLLGNQGQIAPPPDSQSTFQPQATIVGQNETGAIIEVVCSCGQKLQVVCEFPSNMMEATNGIQ